MTSAGKNLNAKIVEYAEMLDAGIFDENRGAFEKLARELNDLFWKRVDTILEESFNEAEQKARFSQHDTVLLNTGLINDILIDRHADELSGKFSVYDRDFVSQRVYFFADFLLDKFQELIASTQIDSPRTEEDKNITLKHLLAHRNDAYTKLAPFFGRLPGMNPTMVETVCSGKIDDQIDTLNLSLIANPIARTRDQRDRLVNFRRTIFNRMHEANLEGIANELVDEVQVMGRKVYTERKIAHYETGLEGAERYRIYERRLSRRDVATFFKKEIRLVKANLNLGAMAAGLTRVTNFTVSVPETVSCLDIIETAGRVAECDFHFPELPRIIIAPFDGGGFFEWDTDTLFIPIAPEHVPETIVGALAAYRLTMDLRNDDSRLRNLYETEIERGHFRDNFIHDYTTWILNYGFGLREGLDERRFNFFKTHLSPPLDDVIVPVNLTNLTEMQEKDVYERSSSLIRTGSQDPRDYHTLFVLLVKQARYEAAEKLILQATDLFPGNGFLMMNLALLYHFHLDNDASARRVLSFVVMKDPESIWRIFAEDLLDKW